MCFSYPLVPRSILDTLLTIYCNFYNLDNRIDFSPCVSDFRELSVAHLLHSQRAALVCGLSDSSTTRSRPRRPPVRSYALRGSVRDRFRLLLTTRPSRAPCSPPFPFPGSLHSRAALAIRTRRTGDRAGPVYDTLRPAEACKTAFAASHPHKSCTP